ncbi:nucleotidyl transferase AbiEii/AbiGii toxin family protein [Candidatus Woesearchaeota archaeon]|nr:nucleotidyl transferase AbiEii/AbiGii toxin family protein [Candidatus Woesearchaeota archaeon]
MENKDDLRENIERIAEENKFVREIMEKDYYLTKILHGIAERQVKDLVFKGGTCLSKCYLDFYRLSEDLDFVYNKDIKDLSRSRVRKKLNEIKKEFFEILDKLEFKVDKELGKGWKMLTSKQKPGIVGLVIIASYISLIDNTEKEIKIEVSFRKKLRKPTGNKLIKHKFYDALNEPLLKDDVKIEAIDLIENFAEKFRALYTRKEIAVRDIYDINHILVNEIKALDKEVFDLIILKINETHKLSEEEFVEFIKKLKDKIDDYDVKELEVVLRADEKVDINKIIKRIENFFGISHI